MRHASNTTSEPSIWWSTITESLILKWYASMGQLSIHGKKKAHRSDTLPDDISYNVPPFVWQRFE